MEAKDLEEMLGWPPELLFTPLHGSSKRRRGEKASTDKRDEGETFNICRRWGVEREGGNRGGEGDEVPVPVCGRVGGPHVGGRGVGQGGSGRGWDLSGRGLGRLGRVGGLGAPKGGPGDVSGIEDSVANPARVLVGGARGYMESWWEWGGEGREFMGHGTGPVAPAGPRAQRRRRQTDGGHFPTLSPRSMSEISDYDSEDEDEENMGGGVSDALKHKYRDETWTWRSFTYDPKPQEFTGRRQYFHHMSTILQLFELFWPLALMQNIVGETNRYATEHLDAHGNT
jgi:hypothetical protein